MIKIKGLRIKSVDDNAFSVHDQRGRLGSIIRYYMPQKPYPSAKKMFRAFGENFETIQDAVSEFLKIKGCKPFNTTEKSDNKIKGIKHINLEDGSGKKIEVTILNDDSFLIYGYRFWFSRHTDLASNDHFCSLTQYDKEYLTHLKNKLNIRDTTDEICQDEFPIYVYRNDREYSVCALIKIDNKWIATSEGGEITTEANDKITAAVQLLCNII